MRFIVMFTFCKWSQKFKTIVSVHLLLMILNYLFWQSLNHLFNDTNRDPCLVLCKYLDTEKQYIWWYMCRYFVEITCIKNKESRNWDGIVAENDRGNTLIKLIWKGYAKLLESKTSIDTGILNKVLDNNFLIKWTFSKFVTLIVTWLLPIEIM